MQQQVWRELFTRAASAAAAARVNNSRHIVSGIWLRYFFKDHKRRPKVKPSLRRRCHLVARTIPPVTTTFNSASGNITFQPNAIN